MSGCVPLRYFRFGYLIRISDSGQIGSVQPSVLVSSLRSVMKEPSNDFTGAEPVSRDPYAALSPAQNAFIS